jgi:protein phosphatase
MPTVTIPDPSLVVLVGAAGAGKSTFARRWFRSDEILSSDAYRAVVSGDESNQAATAPAFARLHRELVARLRAGRLTVVDATNVRRHARRALLQRAGTARIPTVAIVLDLPSPLVLERNRRRPGRVVPEEAVREQLREMARLRSPATLRSEGWSLVVRCSTTEALDGLAIERASSPWTTAELPPGADQREGRSASRPNRRARTSTHTPFRR